MKSAVFAAIGIHLLCLVNGKNYCGLPPSLENASPLELKKMYALGEKVQYKCNYGYMSQGFDIHLLCQLKEGTDEPIWTNPQASCIPRSCADPGQVNNAQRIGSRFTFPNFVEYVCNEGYILSESSKRYCQTTGYWSGALPTCVAITCSVPKNPENGKALYFSLEFASELSYKCNTGFQISSNVLRICGSDGLWTGEEPICSETFCDLPVHPEHGNVNFVGNKIVLGTIVVFTCNPGKTLIGSDTARCLDTGDWTFPTPECVDPCQVPEVLNGQLVMYSERYSYLHNKYIREQKKIPIYTILDEGKEIFLSCVKGYIPAHAENSHTTNFKIICNEGKLIPEPSCIPKPCLIPHIPNGAIIIRQKPNLLKTDSRTEEEIHAGTAVGKDDNIFLKCSKGYTPVSAKNQNVDSLEISCDKEKFSPEPKCTAIRCQVPHVPNGSIKTPRWKSHQIGGWKNVAEGTILNDDDEIVLECDSGYAPVDIKNTQNHRLQISCSDGNFLPEPKCIPMTCDEDPPPVENGYPVVYSRKQGYVMWYDCEENFKKVKKGFVQCESGLWTGTTPVCKDMRCYAKDLKFESLVIEPFEFVYENMHIEPKCDDRFELSSSFDGKINCIGGDWIANTQPCVKVRCREFPTPIENGKVTGYSMDHNGSVKYECDDWFHMLESPNVTCQFGVWVGSPPVCQDTRCYLKNLVENEGVVLHDNRPINPKGAINVTCEPGYILRYPTVTCFDGVLTTVNNLSPCQRDGSEIHFVNNATLQKGSATPNTLIEMTDKKTDVEIIGNNETSEMHKERRNKESVIPKINATTQNGLDVLLISTMSNLNISSDQTEETTAYSEVILATTNFIQAKPSDIDLPYLPLDSTNTTENVTTEILQTENNENACQCVYNLHNKNVLAFNGNSILHYNDTVEVGAVLKFYCSDIGGHRLFGPTEITCKENCFWHSSMFPDCRAPTRSKDVIIEISSSQKYYSIGPKGVITFFRGSQLVLSCRTLSGKYNVDFSAPVQTSGKRSPDFLRFTYAAIRFRISYTFDSLMPRDSGIYECTSEYNYKHSVNIEIKDVICPELSKASGLIVSYRPDEKSRRIATFQCSNPYKMNGPQSITCQPSGTWSEPPASCQLPNCSIKSLLDTLPEKLSPMLKDFPGDTVLYNDSIPLYCNSERLVLSGSASALCRGNDEWNIGNTECKTGCSPLPKKLHAREPTIFPEKKFYEIGDSVVLTCSKGKRVSTDFERVACFHFGWSEIWSQETAPECVSVKT